MIRSSHSQTIELRTGKPSRQTDREVLSTRGRAENVRTQGLVYFDKFVEGYNIVENFRYKLRGFGSFYGIDIAKYYG